VLECVVTELADEGLRSTLLASDAVQRLRAAASG
jgi:hypothetical protein